MPNLRPDTMLCNVCQAPLAAPIYESRSEQSLTSLCELRPGRTRVWCCEHCGHLQDEPLADTAQYYASDYRILLDHEDEDQIYETVRSPDGSERIVYRTEHQLRMLLERLPLATGAYVLDYGCAKAAMPRLLAGHRPDLQLHLFDVSDMYRGHWDGLLPRERQAVHETPPDWSGRFDAVTSFFALEHIPAPRTSVAHVASLLREGGRFYGVVPCTVGNPADFVVIDHVNHFTASSLHRLLADSGFGDIEIEAGSHRGALVFRATKGAAAGTGPSPAESVRQAVELAHYWGGLGERIAAAEIAVGEAPAAIYGSGFYGAYIATCLAHPERLRCFLDRSPFQQGKTLSGLPVLAPEELPEDVVQLYVGLNPAIARRALADQSWLADQRVRLFFLDEQAP